MACPCPPVSGESVRQALDRRRERWKGSVDGLVLCKGELYFYPHWLAADTVYPVSRATAEAEAEFYGVVLQEA